MGKWVQGGREDETFEKIIPKNPILGSIVGVFLGFFLPACDCAVIPVAKRLLKKYSKGKGKETWKRKYLMKKLTLCGFSMHY